MSKNITLQQSIYDELYKPDKGIDIIFPVEDPKGRIFPVREAANYSLQNWVLN